jgi:hypothetical protein
MNQNPALSTIRTEINHSIRATRTAIQRYSIKSSDNRIRTARATRSKGPHLGITIRRWGQAFGLTDFPRERIDLHSPASKIPLGWVRC